MVPGRPQRSPLQHQCFWVVQHLHFRGLVPQELAPHRLVPRYLPYWYQPTVPTVLYRTVPTYLLYLLYCTVLYHLPTVPVPYLTIVLSTSVRRRPGKHVLLGDNLSSHLSVEVIDSCREHNVEFVCLPVNSTDKMQPLDVGFFAPLKGAWRKLLKSTLGWCL